MTLCDTYCRATVSGLQFKTIPPTDMSILCKPLHLYILQQSPSQCCTSGCIRYTLHKYILSWNYFIWLNKKTCHTNGPSSAAYRLNREKKTWDQSGTRTIHLTSVYSHDSFFVIKFGYRRLWLDSTEERASIFCITKPRWCLHDYWKQFTPVRSWEERMFIF